MGWLDWFRNRRLRDTETASSGAPWGGAHDSDDRRGDEGGDSGGGGGGV